MKEQIWEYLVCLNKDILFGVYVGLGVSLCVGTIILLTVYGLRKGARLAIGLLLVEYVVLLYLSTVILRATTEKFSGYDYHPFWSYWAIFEGRDDLIVENLMNAVVFVPVGVMLGFGFRSMTWKKALGIGCGLSVGIELMQLMLKRGFAEVDDVMHNTLGCLVGYGVLVLTKRVLKYGK